ncbi:MAG: type III-A CRISPR-associated protein Csm2 [Phormidesmis priestleyi]|uniref:CRISPR system Cms protein Csm2 n=1 Tax=Phormidesmis priestleyi TaxID=268141 RepID=A0A2W4ZIZ0_9CYAN|nr:MAG: type III-A CRISPR-associated protein Csm2 [Phormidesmis priestleyi]
MPSQYQPPQKITTPQKNSKPPRDIVKAIIETIHSLEPGLQAYPIRALVEDASELGPFLRNQRLETNQIRKFLDAINRVKADLVREEPASGDSEQHQQQIFADIESDIVLLKPKLAYAAARQRAAKPLSDVMSAAIDKVYSLKDFDRLVQFIESIIAYHKAEGGR